MSIGFDREVKTFTLSTAHSTYQMQIGTLGHLRHLYYGRKTPGDRLDYQYILTDCGFSPNAYEIRLRRDVSMDLHPQEYSGSNTGDFRLSALECTTSDGAYGVDLRYVSHEVREGKFSIPGLPASFAQAGEAQTLAITLADAKSGLTVELLYGVFEQADIIARAAHITNNGDKPVWLDKAASVTLDLPFGEWDMLHFHGRHTMERQVERIQVMNGILTVASRRGSSSHHHNPFVILSERNSTEDHGDCYGAMLVYSGNHRTDVEKDQMGMVRLVSGIHDEQFEWILNPGESFDTPEALLAFSGEGFTKLSHLYHRFLRRNMMKSEWKYRRRPVLINNWEATYFNFDSEKIIAIARQAKELGVEMFVLDDGWFGKRDDDNAGLGDWTVNERKIPGGFDPLIEKINAMGMRFGLWIEPEMVNEDSNLYRAHPDWALTVPGRAPSVGRNQLVLDFSRKDVVDHLYEQLAKLLREHHIEYIKWDMNRNMTDVYSHALPPERQGEVFHRYILGVYDLLQRLTSEFPHVLFEGCAGGGGRFDAGMLQYVPQIWCSDNSEAIDRMTIQYGTSFGYPISSMGAHVSVCPNHQNGRSAPLGTRAIVAMSGTFGYELDLRLLSDEEKEEVKEQIRRFDGLYDLIQNGDYYRLTAPNEKFFHAWQFVKEDASEALVNLVVTQVKSNFNGVHFKMKGLNPEAMYRLADVQFTGCKAKLGSIYLSDEEMRAHLYSGASLMYAGFTLPTLSGDFPGAQLRFVKI